MGNAYRSVLASGGAGTPITPSNSSPASMTQGETYTSTANGKAVESVTDITPSNSSPPALSAGNIYKPGSSGYAIGSYSNISPSSSGTYFSSGMKSMSSSGYAYSSRPDLSETTLWTNNSPTSNFAPQSITLNQSMLNFTYIKIKYRQTTTESTEYCIIVKATDLYNASFGSIGQSFAISVVSGAGTNQVARSFFNRLSGSASTTSIYFKEAIRVANTYIYDNYCIPTSIVGMK